MSLNGSTLSIDQQHTCATTVMVCSGLNHKNCQSWSRLVRKFSQIARIHLQFSIFILVTVDASKTVSYHEMEPTTEAAVLRECHIEYRAPLNVKQSHENRSTMHR